jgi:TPR repeat protein
MRQMMIVTVLLGFLVSAAAIFMGDAFLVTKTDSPAIASPPPTATASAEAKDTLRVMRWLSEAVGHVDFGKHGVTWPGFDFVPAATNPPATSGSPSQVFLPFEDRHSGSRDPEGLISAALPTPASAPDGSVQPSHPLAPGVEDEALSASHGDASAQYRLALAYRDGKGAPQDPVAAVHWLLAAAKSGHPQGEIALAAMLESGTGVARDRVRAYVWYDRAASGSAAPFIRDFALNERDRLAKAMSDAELVAARKMAAH